MSNELNTSSITDPIYDESDDSLIDNLIGACLLLIMLVLLYMLGIVKVGNVVFSLISAIEKGLGTYFQHVPGEKVDVVESRLFRQKVREGYKKIANFISRADRNKFIRAYAE